MGIPFDYEQDPRREHDPLAAVFCLGTAGLTLAWGLLIWLDVRAGGYDGLMNAWWAMPYLAGAVLATCLGVSSFLRRESLRIPALLGVAAVLAPLLIALLAAA